jgi:hypothetical protein
MARLVKIITLALFAQVFLMSCNSSANRKTRLKWDLLGQADYANMLSVLPNESVEICSSDQELIDEAKSAIQQWSVAINRWGHFKLNDCGKGSDLRINMVPFTPTAQENILARNFYWKNPGHIDVLFNITGDFKKAVVLHELGHSFGLCDQYEKEGYNPGCSGIGTPRKQNNEIMGATDQTKLKLTDGDIKGALEAATNPQIPFSKPWKEYLDKISGSVQKNSGPIFAMVVDTGTPDQPKIAVSVPKGQNNIAVCFLQSGVGTCDIASPRAIPFKKTIDINDRDIWVSQDPVGNLLANGSAQFELALLGSQTNFKFRVRRP